MGRTAKTERNDEIVKLWREGWTYQRLAVRYGLSISRVGRIVRYVTRKEAA